MMANRGARTMAVPCAGARPTGVAPASRCRAVPEVAAGRQSAVRRRVLRRGCQPGDRGFVRARSARPAGRPPPVRARFGPRFLVRGDGSDGLRRAPRALDDCEESPHRQATGATGWLSHPATGCRASRTLPRCCGWCGWRRCPSQWRWHERCQARDALSSHVSPRSMDHRRPRPRSGPGGPD